MACLIVVSGCSNVFVSHHVLLKYQKPVMTLQHKASSTSGASTIRTRQHKSLSSSESSRIPRFKGSSHAVMNPWQARSMATDGPTSFTAETVFKKFQGLEIDGAGAKEKITKVTVVGVGSVGMACAQTILTQNLTDELALVDVVPDKLRGEMLDLQHAAAFLPNVKIVADTDYAVTADSDLCIITAGARQREGEDRLSLVERNFNIFKSIVPQLVRHSPDTMLLVVSNPVDILTWVAWKLSGLPPSRVLGSGTNLDSSRFRFLLANFFGISAQNVHAQILGEHGDTSVPLWSSVSIAGVTISNLLRSKGMTADPEELRRAHQTVVDGAYEVIKLKGYTSWAIGYSVAGLVSSLLRNQSRVHPVSVLAQGCHGIELEVFLSLPAVLGRSGVRAVAMSELSKEEKLQLQKSAKALHNVQSKLDTSSFTVSASSATTTLG